MICYDFIFKREKKFENKSKIEQKKIQRNENKKKRSQKREKSEAIKLSMILSRYLFYGIKSKIEDGRKQNQQMFVIILHKKGTPNVLSKWLKKASHFNANIIETFSYLSQSHFIQLFRIAYCLWKERTFIARNLWSLKVISEWK